MCYDYVLNWHKQYLLLYLILFQLYYNVHYQLKVLLTKITKCLACNKFWYNLNSNLLQSLDRVRFHLFQRALFSPNQIRRNSPELSFRRLGNLGYLAIVRTHKHTKRSYRLIDFEGRSTHSTVVFVFAVVFALIRLFDFHLQHFTGTDCRTSATAMWPPSYRCGFHKCDVPRASTLNGTNSV